MDKTHVKAGIAAFVVLLALLTWSSIPKGVDVWTLVIPSGETIKAADRYLNAAIFFSAYVSAIGIAALLITEKNWIYPLAAGSFVLVLLFMGPSTGNLLFAAGGALAIANYVRLMRFEASDRIKFNHNKIVQCGLSGFLTMVIIAATIAFFLNYSAEMKKTEFEVPDAITKPASQLAANLLLSKVGVPSEQITENLTIRDCAKFIVKAKTTSTSVSDDSGVNGGGVFGQIESFCEKDLTCINDTITAGYGKSCDSVESCRAIVNKEAGSAASDLITEPLADMAESMIMGLLNSIGVESAKGSDRLLLTISNALKVKLKGLVKPFLPAVPFLLSFLVIVTLKLLEIIVKLLIGVVGWILFKAINLAKLVEVRKKKVEAEELLISPDFD